MERRHATSTGAVPLERRWRADLRRSRRHPRHALLGRACRKPTAIELNRRVTPLAALHPGAGRAWRHAAVQPARRERAGPGRQAVPGDPGGRRGAAQRGAAALSRAARSTARSIRSAATSRRSSTRCSAPRRGTSRRSACSSSPRPSPSRCSACWRSPPRTKCCARSAGASCRTRRATWASPCCRCRPSSARRRKPSIARWRISRVWALSRTLLRHLPARRLPGNGLQQVRARGDQALPARARGRRRRDRLPQVLPPRPAWRPWCATCARSGC